MRQHRLAVRPPDRRPRHWASVTLPEGLQYPAIVSEEMKQYKALHTLWCGGDLAPARVYRLARYYAAQYKNFAHYYFDKSKEK